MPAQAPQGLSLGESESLARGKRGREVLRPADAGDAQRERPGHAGHRGSLCRYHGPASGLHSARGTLLFRHRLSQQPSRAHRQVRPTGRFPTRPFSAASTATTACRFAGSRRRTCSWSWVAKCSTARTTQRRRRTHDGAGVTTLFAHVGGDVGVENRPGWPACRCCAPGPSMSPTDLPGTSTCTLPTPPGNGRRKAIPRTGGLSCAPSISSMTAMAAAVLRPGQSAAGPGVDGQARRHVHRGGLPDQPHLGDRVSL